MTSRLWVAAAALLVAGATQTTTARLDIETLDGATGRPAAARLYLTDSKGAPVTPLGAIAYHKGRVYVKLAEPFSYDAWLRGLKAGRNFATNGPMIFFTVDGREAGATLPAARRGARVRVRAEARSIGEIARLEIIRNGRVLRGATSPDRAGRWLLDFETRLDESGWFAARAFEKPTSTIRFAHTSPIYCETGPRASASADARFFLDWIDREITYYEKAEGFRAPEHRAAMLDLFRRAREVYARVARGE